jgi:hypothetical protein
MNECKKRRWDGQRDRDKKTERGRQGQRERETETERERKFSSSNVSGNSKPANPVITKEVLCFFETRLHYVTQACIELVMLFPQCPAYWDYRCTPPCLAQ